MNNASNAPQWDPAWLNKMYDNITRVAESKSHLASWQQRSATLRKNFSAQNSAHLDLAYGRGQAQTLDIFQPSNGRKAAPVFIYIHGGWWSNLDKSDHSFIAEKLCAQGVCVVVVNYTLSPLATIPQITEEIVQAVAWIHNHIVQYGGDPNKITLSGHSAGGHLTAMMLTQAWADYGFEVGLLPFRNALSISGVFDLAPIMHAPFLSHLQLTQEQLADVSPILRAPNPTGKLYVVAGNNESEEFLRHNQLIQATWGLTIVPLCEAIGDMDHFTIVDSLTDETSRLYHLALELLSINP